MLNLAEAFRDMDHPVDLLLLDEAHGRPVPDGVNVVRLGHRTRQALGPVVRYLRMVRPGLIISARDYINLLMLAGRKAAGLSRDAKLIWTYHTHTSSELRCAPRLADQVVGALADRLIQQVDARVGVSMGVAQDLERRLGLAPGKVGVVSNPIWTKSRLDLRNAPCPHPWLSARQPGERSATAPVVVGVGRLTTQKDFANLLDSFALLQRQNPSSRLIILGEGEDRVELVARAERLGLANRVSMPGHVPDPLPYLSRADLFVLSSRWEGFSIALVEALGAGCPVVSTDCPSGPSEILEGGRIASLVPPGDPAALALAMERTLAVPGSLELRLAASLKYDAQRAAREYLRAVALHE